MKAALVLTAAGLSTRLGLGKKKEFLTMQSLLFPQISGTVLSCVTEAFLVSFPYKTYLKNNNAQTVFLSQIIITTPKGEKEATEKALYASPQVSKLLKENNITLLIVNGGKTRQESVYNGLQALNKEHSKIDTSLSKSDTPDIVLVHDAARPFVTEKIIHAVVNTVLLHEAAVPAIQPIDTQKEIDSDGKITRHLQRSSMAAVQTPQGFLYNKLLLAHKKAAQDSQTYTDDTEIWGTYCGQVYTCPSTPDNLKITYHEDLQTLNSQGYPMIRIGLGYDLHQLVTKRPLILGGITIPSQKGEKAHSDGDVLLHAITDALLGAAALGDIGELFPPSDPTWKDANSAILLKTAWNKVCNENWKLQNLDCVIALQEPKFLPYRDEICKNIASILEVSQNQIFVKAKTGEHLGPVGTCEAVEVWATCLLTK